MFDTLYGENIFRTHLKTGKSIFEKNIYFLINFYNKRAAPLVGVS